MRFISWNCRGAFRRKFTALDKLVADLLIIQECENPAIAAPAYRDYQKWAGREGAEYLWRGDSPHKGLGVFSRTRLPLRAQAWQKEISLPIGQSGAALSYSSAELKLFLPFAFGDYQILAVWTKKGSGAFAYIGQLWQYIQLHRQDFATASSLIIGDFNSNAIWDKKHGRYSHSAVVAELASLGLESIYHRQYYEQHGQETQPSFFQTRGGSERGYHIDYAFASRDLISKAALQFGPATEWRSLSDHLPLILAIKDK